MASWGKKIHSVEFWSKQKGSLFPSHNFEITLSQLSNGYHLCGSGGPLILKKEIKTPRYPRGLMRPGFVIRMDKASQSDSKEFKLWQVLAIPCSIA